MSSPVPAPSKAALHALRGLLFGTSCSLVLLAEERRQRIKFARSAVENGRRLRSVRRYNTSGGAAVEERIQDALRDPDFICWSNPSGHMQSLEEHDSVKIEESYQGHRATNDLGPDPRYPRRSLKLQHLKSPLAEPSTRKVESHTRAISTRLEPAGPGGKNHIGSRLRSSALDELPGLRTIVLLAPSPHSLSKALGRTDKLASGSSVSLIWDRFLNNEKATPSQEIATRALGLDRTTISDSLQLPGATLDLFKRVLCTVNGATSCPSWLLELSVSLSTACHNEGDFETAGRILEALLGRVNITEQGYQDHKPYAIVWDLISQESLLGLDGSKVIDRLDLAAKLYLPRLLDDSLSQLDERAAVGSMLMNAALSANHMKDLNSVFEEVRISDPVAVTTSFIEQLRSHDQHIFAIDTFLRFYVPLPGPLVSGKGLCSSIVDSVVETKGYGASQVLRSLKTLRENHDLQVSSVSVKRLLWCHWISFVNYQDTEQLYREIVANNFFDIQHSYEIRATMVRISTVAGEDVLALSEYEALCALYPTAQQDLKLLGAFATAKAKRGDWSAVRADFEVMKRFSIEGQEAKYSVAFGQVLAEFAKTHTWGETEEFLEQYIQDMGVCLDNFLVSFIAERHGRCRDIKALRRWLEFCASVGFAAGGPFWIGIFKNAVRSWSYSNEEVLELCHTLRPNLGSDYAEVEKVVKTFISTTKSASQKIRRGKIAMRRGNVADEQTVFERMMAETVHKNWECAYRVYTRAVHNGMGFSKRCLRLAVQASVSVDGASSKRAGHLLRKAQSEGHDTKVASVPLVLAELAEIYEVGRAEAAVSADNRGRPYPAIKRLLRRLEDSNVQIDDSVFNRAARTCLLLRNYREAITLCVSAAEAYGNNDLCYSEYNFSNLLYAHTSRHDYDMVRWLVEQVQHKEYRTGKLCRAALKRAIHYLRVASEADKAEEFQASDLAMMRMVTDVYDRIRQEMADWKRETSDVLLSLATKPIDIEVPSRAVHIQYVPLDDGPRATSKEAWQRLEANTVEPGRRGKHGKHIQSKSPPSSQNQEAWQRLPSVDAIVVG